jgi:hypothetical protein
MSKKEFTPDVTPALLADVKHVLDMSAKNKYSTAKIYAAYNAVTGKNDAPQNCVTCLRNRVRALKVWHDAYVERTSKLMEPAPVFPPGGVFYAATDADKESGEFVVEVNTAPPQDEEQPDDVTPDATSETRTVLENGVPVDVIRLHVPTLELPVYFEPGDKDPAKGKARYEGGASIKPGKYVTSDDRELAVQPGGKATLKAAPDNDLL